jgi:hypothetical protein
MTGLMAEGRSQVRFTNTGGSGNEDVFFFIYKAAVGKPQQLGFIQPRLAVKLISSMLAE